MAIFKSGEAWKDSLNFVVRAYAESIIIAVIIALLIRFFVLAAYKIPTSTMAPTLLPGDFVFAYKLPYGIEIPFSGGKKIIGLMPEPGEVFVFRCTYDQTKKCIKRVVGVEGDRIEIRKKRLYVNGKPVKYETLSAEQSRNFFGGRASFSVNEVFNDSTRYPVLLNVSPERDNFGPIVVPKGHFFSLADNREDSRDSRHWGAVPISHIEGRVFTIWLSLEWFREKPLPQLRWKRLMQAVD